VAAKAEDELAAFTAAMHTAGAYDDDGVGELRWVTLRACWVTLRARWVTLRARWVTLELAG
jgi:hypothetical protein